MIESVKNFVSRMGRAELINELWTVYDNYKWDNTNLQEKGMFLNDPIKETATTKAFPDFYSDIRNATFIPRKNSWYQKIETEYGNFESKARVIRSGTVVKGREIPTGQRSYDPGKANLIYLHWASALYPSVHAAAFRFAMPTLNNLNVIAVTAHGHNSIDKDLQGNPMTRTFTTMGELQGTLASLIMLTKNISSESDKPTAVMGISMGGNAALWESLLGESNVAQRFSIASHLWYRPIFFNNSFRKMTNQYDERLALISRGFTTDYNLDDMEKVVITPEIIRRNQNTHMVITLEDNIISPDLSLRTKQLLQIPESNCHYFSRDHKSIGLDFGLITQIFDKKLQELI